MNQLLHKIKAEVALMLDICTDGKPWRLKPDVMIWLLEILVKDWLSGNYGSNEKHTEALKVLLYFPQEMVIIREARRLVHFSQENALGYKGFIETEISENLVERISSMFGDHLSVYLRQNFSE